MSGTRRKYFSSGFDHHGYRFDNFVVGSSNLTAYNTLTSIAESWPDQRPQPLLLSGGCGFGKTHLLVALVHRIQERFKGAKICWTGAEQFMTGLIQATSIGELETFRTEYAELDVLIVESIQFFADKPRTQAEALRAFTMLREQRKLLVIDGDYPASETRGLSDELVVFLGCCRPLTLEKPNLEERKAIVRAKYRAFDGFVPENLIEFLAAHCTRNTRELEGAINRIEAFRGLYGTERTVAGARLTLEGVL